MKVEKGRQKLLRKSLAQYDAVRKSVVLLLEESRHIAARAVNTVMTSTYWQIGRILVEWEQGGKARARYGETLLERLSHDLGKEVGRGFSVRNLRNFRSFYLTWQIRQMPSAESKKLKHRHTSIRQTASAELMYAPPAFALPWSHYVRLLAVKNDDARKFYEEEALRNGWSVNQLDRQISALFYERTAMSRNKALMLTRQAAPSQTTMTLNEQFKDPFILEFLGLKDEYSESDLEESLIKHLEFFLMEMGDEFAFIGRQRRLRIGNRWYRIDLLFFHRGLKSLVVIDLKVGAFDHADAGQMHLYLNYATEHWVKEGENPPVGLILCAEKDSAVATYSLENLPNKVLAAEYRITLPEEALLAAEIEKTQRLLLARKSFRRSDRAIRNRRDE